MKIIVVSDYARIVGGAAKIAIMSALALADRGHEVAFFAGAGPVGPELASNPKIAVTCLGDVAHNRDPQRLRGAVRGLYYRRAANELRKLLSGCDRRDTIVHLHAYRDILTASVADVACKMGSVTVYTAHEYTMGCPYGGFFDYRKNHVCQHRGLSLACLKTRCNTSGYGNKLWYYLAEVVYSKVCRIPSRISHVVFISGLNRRVLEPYLGRGVRHTIVSNPSDFADAEPSQISEESPFLFVGALEPHKDPVTAARAAKALGASITFVGSGSEEERIRRENPDAELTGWVGREEVENRLRKSRALVFPSIWYEAQPCTTMEAAACGVPIIVSDVSSAAEQVDLIGVGEVFRGGEVEDLTGKMRPYLDVNFARRQGLATFASYRRHDFGAARHIDALLAIYAAELGRLG